MSRIHSVTRLARAKINLALDVLGRRPDGYHEVRTVMQTIALGDRITVSAAAELLLISPLGLGEDDLCLRAARELQATCGVRCGARIVVEKTVPVAAGLGGGSSDAAATLLALRDLWQLSIPEQVLQLAAARLGSDVPFFLRGGTALATGRGEQIEEVETMPRRFVFLAGPRRPLRTADVYAAVRPAGRDHSGMALAALAEGAQPPLGNDLEPAALSLMPDIGPFLADCRRLAGEAAATVSGSGPTVLVVLQGPQAAPPYFELARRAGFWSQLTVTWQDSLASATK